jgi:hypothetical protein
MDLVPEVNSNDGVPLLLGHRGEGLIPKDTRIGDKDMNSTEGIQCSLDDGIAILC